MARWMAVRWAILGASLFSGTVLAQTVEGNEAEEPKSRVSPAILALETRLNAFSEKLTKDGEKDPRKTFVQTQEDGGVPIVTDENDLKRTIAREMLWATANLLSNLQVDAAATYGATVAGIATAGFQDVTSPWKSPDVRGTFDTIESVTSVLGPVALAASVFFLANNQQTEAKIAGGVGGLGISIGLLGKYVFGNTEGDVAKKQTETAQRASEALQQIEISRRAFDDIQIQVALLNKTREKARVRLNKLRALHARANELRDGVETGSTKQEDVIVYVDQVLAELGTNTALAGFVIDYIDGLITLSQTYQKTYPGKLQNLNFKQFDADTTALRDEFNKEIIEPYINPMPRAVAALQTWRQQATESLVRVPSR